jgi:hypothetical protein
MGTYRCPIAQDLRPKSHDWEHWDGSSYTCPILREEIEKATRQENWKRLSKLADMAVEYFS